MENKYYVVEIGSTDEWDQGVYNTLKEAQEAARDYWNRLFDEDRKHNTVEIRQYKDDIEIDDGDYTLDCNIYNWGYEVDYGTTTEIVNGTLKEAKEVADKGISYNQQACAIIDVTDDSLACVRRWYGYEMTEDDEVEDPIGFGSLGFYGDWEED